MSPDAPTPRDRVLTALRHEQPPRVPFSWGFGPTPEMTTRLTDELGERGIDWPALRRATADVVLLQPAHRGGEFSERDANVARAPGAKRDLWGVGRKTVSYGGGSYEEIDHYPLAGTTDPAALDDYPWPDPDAYDYAGFAAAARELRRQDQPRALRVLAGNPFEIYCWMTGLEESLMNVLVAPDVVRRGLEHVTRFWEGRLERIVAAAGDLVDMWFFADDLGGQQGLLLSRQAYDDVLRPFHVRLFSLAKRLTPHAAVMMHSDGSVFDLLDDLLAAGLEMLEAVQTDCAKMEPERLKGAFGDRLAFHGGISVQQLLPHSDAATVERRCRELVEIFGAGGGYVAAPSHAIQVGTPVENVLAMLRGVLGEEDYQAALNAARA